MASQFVGFEEPELSPDQPTWRLRLFALSQRNNAGKWAKYGPFEGVKSALNAGSRCRVLARNDFPHIHVDVVVGESYVYVRATEDRKTYAGVDDERFVQTQGSGDLLPAGNEQDGLHINDQRGDQDL
jgi:hypothetical protein